jgi:hypothetical protein
MSKLLQGVTKKTLVFGIAGAIGGLVGNPIAQMLGLYEKLMEFMGGMLYTAAWIAFVGLGIAIALLTAQSIYLKKAPQIKSIVITAIISVLVSAASGAVMEVLFDIASINALASQIARVIAWGILGLVLGWCISRFVPNLPGKRAIIAGFVGGLVGGIFCNFLGSQVGTPILGFFIGLTISILEEALREAWLTVVWGPKETRNISLGAKPVIFGTSPEADIYIPDPDKSHNPIRAIFRLENNKVVIEDPASGRRSELESSKQINMGKMSVIVNMKKDKVPN